VGDGELVPELGELPAGLMLDGELVSFDADGRPSLDRLGQRMLMRRPDVPVSVVAFDLLAIDGTPTITRPYAERLKILEAIWATVRAFDDGDALGNVVV
jgi:bifunctional non-homologous end joining protein LigD